MAKKKLKFSIRQIVIAISFVAVAFIVALVVITQAVRQHDLTEFKNATIARDDITSITYVKALRGPVEQYNFQQGNYPLLSQLQNTSFWNTPENANQAIGKLILNKEVKLSDSLQDGMVAYILKPTNCNNVQTKCRGYDLIIKTVKKQSDGTRLFKMSNLAPL